jgi:hypothetical protein
MYIQCQKLWPSSVTSKTFFETGIRSLSFVSFFPTRLKCHCHESNTIFGCYDFCRNVKRQNVEGQNVKGQNVKGQNVKGQNVERQNFERQNVETTKCQNSNCGLENVGRATL